MLGPNAESIHQKVQHTLGNLSLTGYNSELGNMCFADKVELLTDSHIVMNKWICQQKVWTEEQINQRASLLAEAAKKIWEAPTGKAAQAALA